MRTKRVVYGSLWWGSAVLIGFTVGFAVARLWLVA